MTDLLTKNGIKSGLDHDWKLYRPFSGSCLCLYRTSDCEQSLVNKISWFFEKFCTPMGAFSVYFSLTTYKTNSCFSSLFRHNYRFGVCACEKDTVLDFPVCSLSSYFEVPRASWAGIRLFKTALGSGCTSDELQQRWWNKSWTENLLPNERNISCLCRKILGVKFNSCPRRLWRPKLPELPVSHKRSAVFSDINVDRITRKPLTYVLLTYNFDIIRFGSDRIQKDEVSVDDGHVFFALRKPTNWKEPVYRNWISV